MCSAISENVNRKLQKICPGSYDAVIAVFGSIDIAAGCMKFKRNNPSTKLVVYQVDPCVTNEVYKPETLDERKAFERELYETADRIITTPILLRECEQMYPGDIVGKMTAMEFPNVIPGYEDESADGEDIRCLFTGLIYGDFRDPGYTLRLFDGVDKQISFEIVGAVGKPFDAQMPKHRVVCHGRKSLDETKAQLREAHILVNIGNRMLNQVPSKLFEYISYGKPIVNICKNRNCPTIPYLEKYPLALNLFEDDSVELQSEKLNAFILGNYRKRITAAEIESLYKACTPAYCSEQMLDIINS